MRWFRSVLTMMVAFVLPATAQSVRVTERIEVLESRARSDSNDAAAHYNLAMGYWSKKRFTEAERSLRQAVAIEPQFADAWLALSIVHNWDDRFWDQVKRQGGDSLILKTNREYDGYYRRAFLIDPLVDVKVLGATYRISSGLYGSRLMDGLKQFVEGRYDRALELFDRELRYLQGGQTMDSVPDAMLWFRGLAAAHLGRWDAALGDYDILLTRANRRAESDTTEDIPLEANDYRYMVATLNQKMGNTDQALRLYQQVLENDIGHYMAHVQMARIFEASNRWDLALVERRRAVETNPEDASLLLDLGISLGRAGEFAEAYEVLGQSAQMNPRDSRSLFWLGTAAFQLQKAEEARDAFRRFVASAPARYERQIAMARQRLTELQ